jgi:hypothetical protein
MHAAELLHACLGECRDEPEEDEPVDPCPSECDLHVSDFVERCVAEGIDRGDCALRGEELSEACLRDCREGAEPDCFDRCHAHVEKLVERCLLEGLEAEDCRARAERFLEQCKSECSDLDEEPDPRQACWEFAHEKFEHCLAEGEDETTCRLFAERHLAECLGLGEGESDGGGDLPPAAGEEEGGDASRRLERGLRDASPPLRRSSDRLR